MIDLGGVTLVVTGFPRSGTSMMMRMIRKSGIDIITDPKFESPLNPSDPYGALEVEGIGAVLKSQPIDFTANKCFKLVTPYMSQLVMDRPYKAIFMQRDINEIITSLLAMRTVWGLDIAESIDWARGYLTHWNVPTLYVKYSDVINYPKTTIMRVVDFLGVDLDTDGMFEAIDPNARTRYKRDPSIPHAEMFHDTILQFGVGTTKVAKLELFEDPLGDFVDSQTQEIDDVSRRTTDS